MKSSEASLVAPTVCPLLLLRCTQNSLLLLKVTTQQGQLAEMTTEAEARVKMEREAKQEHFAANVKKNAFLDELKVTHASI